MTPAKRACDLVFAVLLVVILGPLMLWIGWRIWREDGAPIFYVAERMKAPDRPFLLWKFRTMTVVPEDQGVSGGNKAARITSMGRWLRARRLDELPQLLNILRGDISFVGPRPPLREYVEKFPDLYAEVLKVRPGVTGLATIRFHAHEERLLSKCRTAAETEAVYTRICIPRKARMDLIYRQNFSICYDFRLVGETISATLLQKSRKKASDGG